MTRKSHAKKLPIASLIVKCALAEGQEREQLIQLLAQDRKKSIVSILEFDGPSPKEVHGRDFDDMYLPGVLVDIVRGEPGVLLEFAPRDLLKRRAYHILNAILQVAYPLHADIVFAALRSRSRFTKMHALMIVSQLPYLHTPRFRHELERLRKLKAIQQDPYCLRQVEHALAQIPGV